MADHTSVFYRTHDGNGARLNISNVLNALMLQQGHQNAYMSTKGGAVRVNNLTLILARNQQYGNPWPIYIGELLKIRTKNLPNAATINGAVSPLSLNPDQGVCESTVFLYDPAKHCIGLVRTNFFRSPINIIDIAYKAQATTPGLIEIKPIIQPQSINTMGSVKKFELSVDIPFGQSLTPAANDQDETLAANILNQHNQFNGGKITISIKSRRGGPALILNSIKSLFTGTTKLSQRQLLSLDDMEIAGIDTNGNKAVLDLLNHIISAPANYPDSRVVTFTQQISALIPAYQSIHGRI